MAISKVKLDQLVTASTEHYAQMHALMHDLDAYYKQEVRIAAQLPDNVRVHKSSKATYIIDSLRDQIRADEPVVVFHERGISAKAKSHKALMEMWGGAMLRRIREVGLSDPTSQAPHDLLLRGAACWKLMLTPLALGKRPVETSKKNWEEERAYAFPFLVKSVDPLLLLPSPGSNELVYVIEKQLRRVMDVRRKYPGWRDLLNKERDKGPLAEVTWVEYWSDEDYVVEADGDRVIEEGNPYDLIPYIFRYSGLGRADADGDPKWLARGILAALEGELEAEVEIKTAMRAAWMFSVFPRVNAPGANAAQVAKDLQKGPGAVLTPSPGLEYTWMEQPPVNQQMMDFLTKVESAIDLVVPPALTQRAADYGIHQALLIGQALKIVSPVRKTFNSMGTELLNKMTRLAQKFSLTMNVSGDAKETEKERMVRGPDFTHPHFEVTFEATDPAEDDRRMLAALAVKREPGLISRRTYIERFMKGVIPNPVEEETQIMAEGLADQLLASGVLLQELMARWQLQQQTQQMQGTEGRLQAEMQQQAAGAIGLTEERARGIEEVAGVSPLPTAGAQEVMSEGV